MRKFGLFVACVLGTVTSGSQRVHAATPTYYDDELEFKAALDETITDDYSDPGYPDTPMTDAVMSAVVGETDYHSTGFSDNNRVLEGGYCAGCNGSFQLLFTSTSVGTNDGVHGVAMTVVANDAGMPYVAFITFADGTTDNIVMPAADTYWGVVAPERIAQIHFGLVAGGVTQSGDFRIDELTIGNQVLPNEGCDGEPLDLSGLTPGSEATVTQEGSTENALDDIAETDVVACWVGDDAREHVYQFEVARPAMLQIDLEGSSYDTKLAVVAGCPAGDVFCQFDDDGAGLQSALECTQYDAGAYSIIVSGSGTGGEYQLNVRDCGAPCGDGVVGGAEECDDAGESDACDDDCTAVACGDGTANATAGEECDDANTDDGDGCSATCTNESSDSTAGGSEGGSATGDTLDGGSVDGSSAGSVSITGGADSGADSEESGSSSSAGLIEDRSGCGCIASPDARGQVGWLLLTLACARRRRAIAAVSD